MHSALTTTKRSAFVLAVALAALLATASGRTAGPRPLFQMPVPCGQTWEASTYSKHWPDPDSIDMAQRLNGSNVSSGEPALASAAGKVLKAYTETNGEHRVYIDHGGGWVTHYIHLEQVPPLAVGQYVAQGEQIGRVSNSGTEEYHLHYSQIKDGKAVRIAFNGTLIDTHQGNKDSWGTWGHSNAEKLTSMNCPGNSFLGFTQNGFRYQYLYKPGTGAVKTLRLDADGTGVTTTSPEPWTEGKGITHLVPFTLVGGQQHLIAYRSSTGYVRFARMNGGGAGTTTISSGTWGKGWTHFAPFSLGGYPYFVAYNSLYGYVNIDRINAEGTGSTTVGGGTWTKGWTQVVPFTKGPHVYLLLYKGGTGAAKIVELAGSGSTVSVTKVWEDAWTKGWTSLVPLQHHGALHLLGYKAASGQVKLMKLNGNAQGFATLGEATWTTTWTAFSPVLIDGAAHVLAYKAGTGETKMLRLNAAGSAMSSIWQGSWTKGWS